jgi:hypothetical protein
LSPGRRGILSAPFCRVANPPQQKLPVSFESTGPLDQQLVEVFSTLHRLQLELDRLQLTLDKLVDSLVVGPRPAKSPSS